VAVLQFRTLGSIDLRHADGTVVSALLAQPKRVALLACLAVATPRGFHRRDKLLPLFWPEADKDHARTSLRKAVHGLRQALGESTVLSRGDEEIGLDFSAIWCDVVAFDRALEAKDAEQALSQYRGDLLSGLHLPNCPEFERWLETERDRLRRRAREAARALARREEQADQPIRAAQWYRRALDLYPEDETDLRALVRLLDHSGDRAGALKEYEGFARRLAVDLEVQPSPESQALIDAVRGRVPRPRVAEAAIASDSEGESARVAPRVESGKRSRWLFGGAVGALAVLGVTAGLLTLDEKATRGTLDTRVVAIMPFRVTGADPYLAFLREGMVDLLVAKLSGTVQLRPVDPRTILVRWHRAGGTEARDLDRAEMLALASNLGAGRLLEGEITGTARVLTLSAVVTDMAGGREVRASVEGSYDSLTFVIDRLAAELLALGAGEPRHRLTALMSTSLPALRRYLDGAAALRRGAYADAVRRFDDALEIDSTFAAAGLARTRAAIWTGEGNRGSGSLRAWPYRARLGFRDRATLRFMLGPNYPYRSTEKEWLASAEEVVVAAPDDPQAWATLGDQLFHYGHLLGMPDALERSLRAYQHALVLDSTYLPGWEHVAEIALLAGDRNLARRSIRARLERDFLSPLAKEDHWLGRRLLGDGTLPDLSLASDSLVSTPTGVAWKAVAFGGRLADADTVIELTLGRVQGGKDRRRAEFRARNYYLVRGWPTRARRVVDETLNPDLRRDFLILDAIYAGGDSTLAKGLVAEAPETFTRPQSDNELLTVILQCVAAQFELARGHPEPARRAVRAWLVKPMAPESLLAVYTSDYAARLLDAQLAALDRRPDARARLEELDSLLGSAPTGGDFFERVGNLEAARLWYEQGEFGRSLASIRRRLEGLQTYSELAHYLRNEGRYAVLAGDRAGAVRAYRRYLALRADAEPPLQPQVDTVRHELAALEGHTAAR
jgi:DNA-binding SARP family transcriptional activator/TolB-like protein